MHFELRQADGRLSFELSEGCIVLGGHSGADVQVPALEQHSVRLWVEGGQWSFMSGLEAEVSGAPLYPDVRRIVLPGETVHLGAGLELSAQEEHPQQPPSPTHSLLKLWMDPGPPTGPYLTCMTGLDAGRVFLVGKNQPSVVGRALSADVRLRDRTVSRVHARVELRDGRAWLSAEGSANPLLLNGAPLTAPSVLESGDLISLGVSQLRYAEPAPPEAPATDVALDGLEDTAAPASAGVDGDEVPDREQNLLEAESTWKRIVLLDRGAWRWLLAGAVLVGLGVFLRLRA